MSLKPPLKCPPDYSILTFRITECKKASVVKGISTLASLDLNNLSIPIKEHTEGTLTLKAGTERVLNIDDIAEYGPLKERYNFHIDLAAYPNSFDDGQTFWYCLSDENLNVLVLPVQFTINVNNPQYADFPTALATTIANNNQLNQLIHFETSDVLQSGTFSVYANKPGVKYRHHFIFDFGGPNEYSHPGTLITPYTKYEKGRVKYILLFPEYEKVDMSTCGCGDASGDMRSNQKYFQYVNRGEYDEVNNPAVSPEQYINNGHIGNSNNLIWLSQQTNTPHLGYQFKVNDIIELVSNTSELYKTRILSIDGDNIGVDSYVDTNVYGYSNFNHAYSPIGPRWNNGGDFVFLSGATDITDEDRCFIDTVVLKNPHGFDIPIRYMIGR